MHLVECKYVSICVMPRIFKENPTQIMALNIYESFTRKYSDVDEPPENRTKPVIWNFGKYNEFIELAANLKEITPFQLTSLISAHRRGKKRFCVQVPVEGPYRFGFPFERGTEAICLH